MSKNSSFFSPNFSSKKLSCLKGNQRILATLFYEHCAEPTLQTPSLTFDSIVELTGINKNSLQTTIRRLIKKGVINRTSFKNGRGGWSIYELNSSLYDDMKGRTKLFTAIQKGRTNHEKRAHKKTHTNIINNIYYNTTTVRESKEWKNVDYSSLQKIGFTKFQVEQIRKKGKLTAQQLQDSINRFAYSLEHNKKYKNHSNHLGLIMGVLIKGGQWHETTYKTPQEIAKERQETVEREKSVESMRLEKERNAALAARAESEINKAFETWQAGLTDQDILRVTTEYAQKVPGACYLGANVRKRLYFRNFVLKGV